jgi:YesN/AraC family two-component response regulator
VSGSDRQLIAQPSRSSRLRIDKPKNLLLNSNGRISEAGSRAPVSVAHHFNRMFRKLTGHSPSAYRAALAR